jgi:SAM-dependent methyltransferase
MSPVAREFAPDAARPGWSRCPIPHGELRARTSELADLERLGLLDPERWRREELGGVTVNRKPDRWVRCIPGARKAVFAKYRRGTRRGEWLEELLHGRRPLSAAGREERAGAVLSSMGLATARVLLAGEVRGALGVERESFLVTEELVGFDAADLLSWDRLAPGLRALLKGLSDRRVAVPDLYAKHLFHRIGESGDEFALVDLLRVEHRPLRSATELFVRHAGGLLATVPGASASELLLALPSGGVAEVLERRIEERADLVRARKKLAQGYPARTRYQGERAIEDYGARSAKRHRAEARLLESVLPEKIDGVVLDVPCGLGRWGELLASRGARVVSLDISPGMAERAGGSAAVGELEHLPVAGKSVEGVLCFRFLHHVPSAQMRGRILAEMARVARNFVIVSFFHPCSAHNAMRVLGGGGGRFSTTLARLQREARKVGLVLEAAKGEMPYFKDLWVARFAPS